MAVAASGRSAQVSTTVDQQRLGVREKVADGHDRSDVRVEEPRVQVFVAQELLLDVDRALELPPDLARHLFARALHRRASVRSRGLPSRRYRPRGCRARRCRRIASGDTLRQNWNCEMLVSAHSVSM